jgi:hypothetical protein
LHTGAVAAVEVVLVVAAGATAGVAAAPVAKDGVGSTFKAGTAPAGITTSALGFALAATFGAGGFGM